MFVPKHMSTGAHCSKLGLFRQSRFLTKEQLKVLTLDDVVDAILEVGQQKIFGVNHFGVDTLFIQGAAKFGQSAKMLPDNGVKLLFPVDLVGLNLKNFGLWARLALGNLNPGLSLLVFMVADCTRRF
jgi:hypothetical protein